MTQMTQNFNDNSWNFYCTNWRKWRKWHIIYIIYKYFFCFSIPLYIFYKFFLTYNNICVICVICVILVQKIYKNRGKNGIFLKFVDQKILFFGTSWGSFAFFSQNPGTSALMIMVNVKSVIFFGKSEKNIWVLDFFNYNHR